MTDIHVRYATLDDVERVAPLFDAYRVFYQQNNDLPLAHQFIRQRLALQESVILLAESEGEAVGFIQLYPSFCSIAAARVWVLYDLFVTESARGQGVSRLLMDKAKQHAQQTGAVRIDLSTAHQNTTAQALYESLGYQLDTVYRYYSLSIV